ncbi:TnsA-like heteromeric transposase endonuclease subunit [Actinokineospora pegani]|uniref:TnsA-like heteromeric transposase endonuclease subunit n=1 Tax=Actinokineospora pegani TaxID=2654637 RepID=UPI0018D2991C|nr:TnsA-like heteromeric transposase endonuclease subunit [Actinokineospora pegani]
MDRDDRHVDRLRVLVGAGAADAARLRPGHRRHRLAAVLTDLGHCGRPVAIARTRLLRAARRRKRAGPRLPPAGPDQAQNKVTFEATRAACELLGWRYEIVGTPPEALLANVRWLAGCRHPRHDLPVIAEILRAVFSRPMPLLEGAEAASEPIAVLPVLFHLLWRQELVAELSIPLTVETEVRLALAHTARKAAT